MNARELTKALNGRWSGNAGTASCPAHTDKRPSLGITERDGKVLFKCHAGCPQDMVIDALRARQLWPEAPTMTSSRRSAPERKAAPSVTSLPAHPELGPPGATFNYYDVAGQLIGMVCRWDKNGSKELRPATVENGGWRWCHFPTPRPLYELPDIVAHENKPVLLVEGEKTADAGRELVDSHVATTWPGGTGAISYVDWSPLQGRDIILWPDADEPGKAAMRNISEQLTAVGARRVRIVKLPDGLPKGWDLADQIPDGLDPVALINGAPDMAAERIAGLSIITAADLAVQEFPTPKWAIPGLVPEGLSILAGRPKTGKSWMALDFAVAVAAGSEALGNIKCDEGDVLLLALEDTARRLNGRLKAVLQGKPAPSRLNIATNWKRADAGGLEDLRAWLTAHRDARAVIIDTLQMMRGQAKRDEGVYAGDYAAISSFKKLADEFTVPIVLLHHLRKESSIDPLEAVSGTAGLTGSADSILVLKREPNDPHGLLYVRGRDVIEAEFAIQFDGDTGKWLRLGAGEDFRKSEQRRAVICALADIPEGLSPCELADVLGKKRGTVRTLLHRMRRNGDVTVLANGRYITTRT